MPLSHPDFIEVRNSPKKGRGVFAKQFISKGSVIEKVPILLVTWDEIADSELADYAFVYTEKKSAIALGYGSIYNHSYKPNARYDDVGRKTKIFSAIRDIEQGEEITVNYNGDPDNNAEVDFPVID
ncbi:SET domain-containing protein [Thalassoglobus polymorphus]|uniref:SET domain protein n=1 Tax=Thalassoglobus polymorphus TaxID=2527994 RepID=A0A517QGP4_9PLAN|nr:SET domain-containing protein [Thalassoglobus polymorphus]QDT30775.1 SET domain protein [Thalassoglobus polymorphus]